MTGHKTSTDSEYQQRGYDVLDTAERNKKLTDTSRDNRRILERGAQEVYHITKEQAEKKLSKAQLVDISWNLLLVLQVAGDGKRQDLFK